jgi:hypothetical protein
MQTETEMHWYAAHIVSGEFVVGDDSKRSLYENIVLFHAGTFDEAFARAERYGIEEASTLSNDESTTLNDLPSKHRFLGVKRVVRCVDDPNDGVEVTYISFELPDGVSAESYVQAEEAVITYYNE